jgi:predicted phage terminase large subunit-like protein
MGTNLGDRLANKMKARVDTLSMEDRDLVSWGVKYVPHYFNKSFCRAHYTISDTFSRMAKKRGQKIVIMMPRGYAKSTFSSFLAPLKAICEGTEKYILLGADTVRQAARYLDSIKSELETNEEIKKAYPQACKQGDVWNAERIETGNECCIEVFGKGTNVRGAKFKQYRPTLIILDDPQSDEDVNSVTTREKDVEWFNRTLEPVGDTGTNVLIIGNNLHRESIVGKVAVRADFLRIKFSAIEDWPENMSLWEEWAVLYHQETPLESLQQSSFDAQNLAIPCNAFYYSNQEAMEKGAKVLWIEKDTLYSLMVLRENLGHSAFDAEKQNNPRDPSRHEFDESWFEGEDITWDKLPAPEHLIKIGYCDPAKGVDSKKRDFSPVITGWYDISQMKCYLEVDMTRRPVNATIDKIIELHAIKAFSAFGIESNGFQFLMSDELFARAQEEGGSVLNVIPVENQGVHKNTRISRLSIWFKRRFFRFKRNCKHTKILLQQLLDHPHSDHDDGPDALEGLIRILTSNINVYTGAKSVDSKEVLSSIEDDGLGDNLCEKLY